MNAAQGLKMCVKAYLQGERDVAMVSINAILSVKQCTLMRYTATETSMQLMMENRAECVETWVFTLCEDGVVKLDKGW